MELLRAYDPRFNIPGRPASEALQPEASAMQDGLLAHPKLADFGSEVRSDCSDMSHVHTYWSEE